MINTKLTQRDATCESYMGVGDIGIKEPVEGLRGGQD